MANRAEIMAKPKLAVLKYGAKETSTTPKIAGAGQGMPGQEKINTGSLRSNTLTAPLTTPTTPTTTNTRTESLGTPTAPIKELGTTTFVANPELERLGASISAGFKSPNDLTDDERNRLQEYLLDKQMNSASYDPEAETKKQGDALVTFLQGIETQRRNEYEEERKRRQREDAQALADYQSQLNSIYAPQFSQARKAGEAREEDFRRDTGFQGFTRSGYLVEGVQGIEADTQAELSKIEALRAADLAYRQAQLEGATADVLKALRDNIDDAKIAVEEQQLSNFEKQQELRLKAMEAGDTATLNMINALAAGSDLAGVDWEASARNGYLTDQNGGLVTNNAGTPQEYNPYEYSTVGGSLYKIDRQGNATLVVGKPKSSSSSSSGLGSAEEFVRNLLDKGVAPEVVNQQIELAFPGTAAGSANQRRAARNYLNTQAASDVADPFSALRNTPFGGLLPKPKAPEVFLAPEQEDSTTAILNALFNN